MTRAERNPIVRPPIPLLREGSVADRAPRYTDSAAVEILYAFSIFATVRDPIRLRLQIRIERRSSRRVQTLREIRNACILGLSSSEISTGRSLGIRRLGVNAESQKLVNSDKFRLPVDRPRHKSEGYP